MIFTYILAFVLGACIGSFLNVCIYRLPREDMSISNPRRSLCFACGKQIRWYDNIPIASYLILGGKCRECHTAYSPRYALVELLTGILFALVAYRFTLNPATGTFDPERIYDPALFIYLVATACLIVCTFVDIDHFIIPDEINLPGMVIAPIAGVLVCILFPESGFLPDSWQDVLLGGALGGGFLWSLGVVATFILKKEAMGFGDVKLMTWVGCLLGWKMVLLALILSSFVGVLVSIPLQIIQGKERFSHIPYGPYLALASFLAMIWGSQALDWYLNLFP